MGVRRYWQQEFILDTWKILYEKFIFWLFLVTEQYQTQDAEFWTISFSLIYVRKRKQAKTLEFSKLQWHLFSKKK